MRPNVPFGVCGPRPSESAGTLVIAGSSVAAPPDAGQGVSDSRAALPEPPPGTHDECAGSVPCPKCRGMKSLRRADDPRGPHVGRSALLGQALSLYIQKIKRENKESRSWKWQPNNPISVVAIVLSLVSLGYGLLKDHYDGIDNNFQSLSTVVTDLTKLDSDILTATLTD